MNRNILHIATVTSLCSLAALLSACDGGGSSSSSGGGTDLGVYTGKTTQASIDQASVKQALTNIKDVMPSCSATGVSPEKAVPSEVPSSLLSSVKVIQRLLPPVGVKKVGKSVSLLATTAPASKNGDCGGSLTYPTYSHASGTTTMSVKWDNYCTVDSTTGNKTTYNGTLSAVDAGTPTPSGPVTNKLTANIPSLTIVEKTASGTIISDGTIAISNFSYTPATGAGSTLSDLPGTISFTSFESKDTKGGKYYKFENMTVNSSKSGTDTQLSISGRVYRGEAGYSDLTTDTPILMDSSNTIKAGKVTFTGASGHKATYTTVPGSTSGQHFTVAVDDTPVSGVQLDCDGLL